MYLVAVATVLGGQDESGQVAGQLEPPEEPNQVPEDDGVLVHYAGGGERLVALVHQQALQLLPQHQGAQIGHSHRGRGRGRGGGGGGGGRNCGRLNCTVCCRGFGLCSGRRRRVLLLHNRISFFSRPEGETEWI